MGKMWEKEEMEISTKSALHEAFKSGNNRVIDIILGHMALIDINNSSVFSDIMPKLTDISSFGHYLENLVTQTQQMKDKSVLRVKEPINETMVAMGSSHTLFIDEEFYRKKFGEDIHDS